MRRKRQIKAEKSGSNASHGSPREPLNFRGLNLAGKDFTEANLAGADFRGALLDSTNFSRAKLSRATFIGCELFWTDFVSADLDHADFQTATFREADLTSANLRGADFTKAMIFRGSMLAANLSHAHLFETGFENVDLRGTDFSNSRCGSSRFCSVNLGTAKGLGTVLHQMPSSVGIDTIVMSGSKISEEFLQGVGVPKVLLDYLLSASTQPLELYSCFISYSSKDSLFAKRLYYDLRAHDVRCWLFEEDAEWGKKVWSEIDRSIKIHDKVIIVCSVHSLQSEPVLREIERALQREDKEKRDVLFPVRLDNYVLEQWEHHRKADVTSKVVGDFSDLREYERSFQKLLYSLNRE